MCALSRGRWSQRPEGADWAELHPDHAPSLVQPRAPLPRSRRKQMESGRNRQLLQPWSPLLDGCRNYEKNKIVTSYWRFTRRAFNPHNNPVSIVALLFLFYRCKNKSRECKFTCTSSQSTPTYAAKSCTVGIQTYVVQILAVPSFPCSTKTRHSWP